MNRYICGIYIRVQTLLKKERNAQIVALLSQISDQKIIIYKCFLASNAKDELCCHGEGLKSLTLSHAKASPVTCLYHFLNWGINPAKPWPVHLGYKESPILFPRLIALLGLSPANMFSLRGHSLLNPVLIFSSDVPKTQNYKYNVY